MTIKEIFRSYSRRLEQIYSKGEAAAITRILIEHFTGFNISQNLNAIDNTLPAQTIKDLEDALQKLLAHTPVQYVTGTAWFHDLKFEVNKSVLIPRPETEELVHTLIQDIKPAESTKILDIGTGSGCIPITIKKNVPFVEMISVDISEAALTVAKRNAALHDVDVQFFCLDFIDETKRSLLPPIDIIISNPPYIPEGEKGSLDKNVITYEPHVALFVPENDALLFYRHIRNFAEDKLRMGGKLFLELHESFALSTAELFSNKYTVEIKKDISGKQRMLFATRCR